MMFLDKVYSKSPVLVQNLLITLYGYYWKNRRLGKFFNKEITNFKNRENYTFQQWENYQEIELRKLLIYAFENVPFYKEKYSKAGFCLNDFNNFKLSDIDKLPFLEKDEVRKYGTSTMLSKKKEKGKFYNSSGSTGTPVSIYFSKKTHQKWFAAYETRVLNWAGVSIKHPRGMIGGRRVLPMSDNKKPFYRYNFAEKQTYFSAYHITENNVKNYLKGILKHKVTFMVGYAMSNYFLAKLIVDNKLKAPKLKAVITSSEKLTIKMREVFKKAYGCKTFDSYSGMEACGLISENIDGDFLFSPDTGIIEVLNDDLTNENSKEGELVLTGLLNYDQPLIRYRIGDRVRLAHNQTSKSGIQMPLISEITGRVEDVLIGEDGRKVVRFHSLFLNIDGLVSSQIIQEELLLFTINLVVENNFNKKNELVILNKLKSQLGNNVNAIFKYLKEIPKNKNGKIRAVINKLESNV